MWNIENVSKIFKTLISDIMKYIIWLKRDIMAKVYRTLAMADNLNSMYSELSITLYK